MTSNRKLRCRCRAPQELVPETLPDIQRRAGCGSTRTMGRRSLENVESQKTQYSQTSHVGTQQFDKRSLVMLLSAGQSPGVESVRKFIPDCRAAASGGRWLEGSGVLNMRLKAPARRRQRLSHAGSSSTTQRIGRPRSRSPGRERFTILTERCGRTSLPPWRTAVPDSFRIGKQLCQEGIHPEQGREQQNPAITILDIRWMHHRVQQQPYRVDQDMPLLASIFLPASYPGGSIQAPLFHAARFRLSITQ